MQKWTWTGARFTKQKPRQKQLAAPNLALLLIRARFYDANLGEFISRDPLGFVDGMSLYQGYFSPGGVDPSGNVEVIAAGAKLGKRHCKAIAAVHQQWQWKVAEQLEAGWVVQKVTVTASKSDCVNEEWGVETTCGFEVLGDCFCDENGLQVSFTYFEAWRVPRRKVIPINPNGKAGKYNDRAITPIGVLKIDKSCGRYEQIGEVRFYTDSQMLAKDQVGDRGAGWTKRKVFYGEGTGFDTTAGDLWSRSGENGAPRFWDEAVPISSGNRSFEVNWKCCHCDPKENQKLIATADPTGIKE